MEIIMRRLIAAVALAALVACSTYTVAEFWRPISEPNLLMSQKKAQQKLEFDLSQCNCGIFPANVTPVDQVAFQPDKQRMVETGVTTTADDNECVQRPSLVVAECMRSRGWEVTRCSGRMPLAGGGSLCTGATVDGQ
jgi:hypothetical protein